MPITVVLRERNVRPRAVRPHREGVIPARDPRGARVERQRRGVARELAGGHDLPAHAVPRHDEPARADGRRVGGRDAVHVGDVAGDRGRRGEARAVPGGASRPPGRRTTRRSRPSPPASTRGRFDFTVDQVAPSKCCTTPMGPLKPVPPTTPHVARPHAHTPKKSSPRPTFTCVHCVPSKCSTVPGIADDPHVSRETPPTERRCAVVATISRHQPSGGQEGAHPRIRRRRHARVRRRARTRIRRTIVVPASGCSTTTSDVMHAPWGALTLARAARDAAVTGRAALRSSDVPGKTPRSRRSTRDRPLHHAGRGVVAPQHSHQERRQHQQASHAAGSQARAKSHGPTKGLRKPSKRGALR